MHEMSLAEGILQIIEDNARRADAGRVRAVWLEIGRLSSVEPDALRFCFDVVVKDTLADGARLEIIDVPGSAWCLQCSQTVEVAARYDECPLCGSYQLQVTGGTEMRVKELEIE